MSNNVLWLLVFVFVVIMVGVGVYLYFKYHKPSDTKYFGTIPQYVNINNRKMMVWDPKDARPNYRFI